MGRLNRATRLFHTLRRSFWVLPTFGCVVALALAIGADTADQSGILSQASVLGGLLKIDGENGRAFFSTIAGATATIMSLTYTLTLLIFTLAAGQLGPRLLDSFYDNRVNQVTITAMSATFVFSIVSMYLTADGQEPRLAALIALILCVISVMLLIYFVHDVAQRVLVDNEIALTAHRLQTSIKASFRASDADHPPAPEIPASDEGARQVVTAKRTGYLRSIDIEELIGDMQNQDALVEILVSPGEFLAERMPIALVRRSGEVEDWGKAIDDRFVYGNSRSSEGDILFSVKLLVEIALRALSPGVNDSFTAISAIDHLSGAFCDLMHREPPSPIYMDDDGTARVMATTLSVEEIVDSAFHPIRLAAAGNMIVCLAIIDAVQRMMSVSDGKNIELLRRHANLIAETALPDRATETDRARLDQKLLTVSSRSA